MSRNQPGPRELHLREMRETRFVAVKPARKKPKRTKTPAPPKAKP